jgi:hypothetical protein
MSEYVYLQGSEDVKNAGHTMQRAAENMIRAANQFDSTLDRQIRFMDDWLIRFQSALESVAPPIEEKEDGHAETLDCLRRVAQSLRMAKAEPLILATSQVTDDIEEAASLFWRRG